MTTIHGFAMTEPGKALEPVERAAPELQEGEALVRVVGCGVCHTDIGFLHGGVRTKHPLPLVLGHEVSGVIEAAGPGAEGRVGQAVIVPAVMPCGECAACLAGRGTICPGQIMPGNDVHGGFATHLVVPARDLCPVPGYEGGDAPLGDSGVGLAELGVIADAISTPWQAIRRAELAPGELAIFVGAGGVGGFGALLAKSMGACVAALDVSPRRVEAMRDLGIDLPLNIDGVETKAVRKELRGFAAERGLAASPWRIFETSGSAPGQELAFGLLNHGATLSVVGFTPARVHLRLSNLMAFDARAIGNWGCDPALYPELVEMALAGSLPIAPMVTKRPLRAVNEVLDELHHHSSDGRRAVLVPDAG